MNLNMEKIMQKSSGVSDGKFSGRVAVIIGGTSGMGLATAKLLLDGGARVLVTGRSQAGLESAQKEIGKHAIVVVNNFRRERQGTAGPSHIRSRQGCAAVISSNARNRVASSRDSRQRGDARSHRHAHPRQSVSR